MLDISPGEVADKSSLELVKAVVSQREFKSAEEIAQLNQAVDVSVDMHVAAMKFAQPGMTEAQVTAIPKEDGIHINGGSVYEPAANKFMIKCDACFKKDPVLRDYQDCEVYSRVVGYLRPVAQWNDAKQAEFKDRKLYDPSIY